MILRQHILILFLDVSKHESNIYRSGLTAEIGIQLLLDQVPANPYNINCVLS